MPRWVVGAALTVAACVAAPAALAAPPQPVSPSGPVELRCPTFSWSTVAGAAGYELLVYAVTADDALGEEPVVSKRLPAGASSWTPPGPECLTAGGRYAWSLRALGRAAPDGWSRPALFEVAAGPSRAEVAAAIATLRRYLATARGDGTAVAGVEAAEVEGSETASVGTERRPPAAGGAPSVARGRGEDTGSVAAASVPTLGSPSLGVDANVSLGAASNLFKDGSVFLWDDTAGNTALGRLALSSASGTATENTAVGTEALRDAVPGDLAVEGSRNTAVGYRALLSNTTGSRNTAVGRQALLFNTTGVRNTAVGVESLSYNTTGSNNVATGYLALLNNSTGTRNTATGNWALFGNTTGHRNTAAGYFALFYNQGSENTAVGYRALWSNSEGERNVAVGFRAGYYATTGDANVFILNQGMAGDHRSIRIGIQGYHDGTYVGGIHGASVDGSSDLPVLVDDTGKLGTATSSRRFKEGIADLGEASRRLFELRPVRFRFKEQEGEGSEQYGLLAEEVAEVFPELVVDDAEGAPYAVRYHALLPLLLNEVQRTRRDLAVLRRRLPALESGREAAQRAPPWWRRGRGGRGSP